MNPRLEATATSVVERSRDGAGTLLDAVTSTSRTATLEQVLSVAALTTRTDRKYLVPFGLFERTRDAIVDGRAALEIDGRRAFGYQTVYFDTDNLQSYLGAAHERRRRFKVRTRTYADQGRCQLEVKQTGGRGETIKVSMPHPTHLAHTLDDAATAFIAEHLNVGLTGRLVPALTTNYRRTTLVDFDSESRVTIDVDLQFTGVDGETFVIDDHVVVETKSTSRATPVDRLLWRHGCRPIGMSKYAVGMAGLHPGLPANKWHRTLGLLERRGPLTRSRPN